LNNFQNIIITSCFLNLNTEEQRNSDSYLSNSQKEVGKNAFVNSYEKNKIQETNRGLYVNKKNYDKEEKGGCFSSFFC
jgi:hypothetical protein